MTGVPSSTHTPVPRTPRWLTAVVAALVVAFVLTGWWVAISYQRTTQNLARQHSDTGNILSKIAAFTDPNSPIVRAQDAKTAAIVAKVIVCIENHDDRLAAGIAHTAPPPLVAGCPATTPQELP